MEEERKGKEGSKSPVKGSFVTFSNPVYIKDAVFARA